MKTRVIAWAFLASVVYAGWWVYAQYQNPFTRAAAPLVLPLAVPIGEAPK